MHIIPLNYADDSTALFESIRHLPYPAFLDSSTSPSRAGHYDILCAAPACRVISSKALTWRENNNGQRTPLQGTPFQALKQVLLEYGFADNDKAPAEPNTFPFIGGALGYFGYDLGRCLESMPSLASADIDIADMQMGIYPWAIIVDHSKQQSSLVYRDSSLKSQLEVLASQINSDTRSATIKDNGFQLNSAFTSNLDYSCYSERFHRVINYIRSGDCYQVNLAQRFTASYQGDSWQAYLFLRKQAPTPFSAYLQVDGGELLSLSPERFIKVADRHVETKPIKGTRPRGSTPAQDLMHQESLSRSSKDKAENLMIVDLLRNDLGRSCRIGSISVPKLFEVESYANVHHLVSTVQGELGHRKDCLDLLEGCFPGGSITGAPKIRAMEVIEELEPHRRSAYCGSIGYIGFDGNVDTNIAIRTIVAHDQQLHCWAGGGIVADSQCSSEYQETFDKISNLIKPLEDSFHDSNDRP
ncbi:MAG: aminodeoxychorismate synthase component I [Motiliproteus sp.]